MRRARLRTQPQVEGLETLTLLSGATAMMTGVHAAVTTAADPPAPQALLIVGTTHGSFISRQSNPDTGAVYSVLAQGRLTPLGATVVSGSFRTPGFILNGQAEGTLTLRDARGSLTLHIVQSSPQTTSSTTNQTTFHFTYKITRGTRKLRNANGMGSLDVTVVPRTSSGTAAHHVSAGRVTMAFSPLAVA